MSDACPQEVHTQRCERSLQRSGTGMCLGKRLLPATSQQVPAERGEGNGRQRQLVQRQESVAEAAAISLIITSLLLSSKPEIRHEPDTAVSHKIQTEPGGL